MAYTTSNPERWNPDSSNHAWFEELCAAAAIGELSSSEYKELQAHLSACTPCRRIYDDFCKLSSETLGILAVGQEDSLNDPAALDEDRLLGFCLEKTSRETSCVPTAERSAAEYKRLVIQYRRHWSMRWHRWAAVAASLLAACGVTWLGYTYRDRQAQVEISGLRNQLSVFAQNSQESQTIVKQSAQLSTQLSEVSAARQQLQSRLLDAEARYAELAATVGNLESSLAAANIQNAQLQQQNKSSNDFYEQDIRARLQLQSDLQQAREQLGQQEQLVAELNNKLKTTESGANKVIGTSENSAALAAVNDNEARQLFGARDLHIVDVYDVDGSGKNRRTYGRVYYVEKKLLLFYAFDLQDKKRNRMAAAFQAWGYQQAAPDKPHSLGLFYVDDSSLNRWALRVNNPRVLERIDAVFVTLEPPEGSPTPRGRRLLYANLGGPPNHP